MKKILLTTVLLTAIITLVLAQKKAAVIEVKKQTYDFGKIKESDGSDTAKFVVRNIGDLPLVLTRAVPTCGCTASDLPKEPIAPNDSVELKVSFDPRGRQGPFTKSISLYSNGKQGSLVLTIKGEVVE